MLLGAGDDAIANKLLLAICDGGSSATNYRADIASILTTRLINYTLNYVQKNKVTDAILSRISSLVKHDEVFTDDLKYHIVKKILNGNKQKFQKLLFDPKVQELATK